jgi:hypothetical protein
MVTAGFNLTEKKDLTSKVMGNILLIPFWITYGTLLSILLTIGLGAQTFHSIKEHYFA